MVNEASLVSLIPSTAAADVNRALCFETHPKPITSFTQSPVPPVSSFPPSPPLRHPSHLSRQKPPFLPLLFFCHPSPVPPFLPSLSFRHPTHPPSHLLLLVWVCFG
ncbi:hypothetical protein E2C01_052081 [Portunus trituberculatus]|uniref:Uncharacterized protein n=1 Tax=Portunus trituberculatus TaxID=210409 RepID=A0A5B7GKK9_PORTR|nr:hypothetical protein [Portunus trituberculatus]